MKNIPIRLLFFSLFTLLLACGEETGKASMPEVIDLSVEENQIMVTQEQFEAANMEMGALSAAVFPYTIQVNGYIDVPPKSRAAVSVYYGGYVKELDLLPGQWVRRGQVLFLLENPDFVQMQQDYLEAKAQLAYLQSDFERQKTLASENIASQKNYLKAESDYLVQQARSEGLRKKLDMLGMDLEQVEARNFVSRVEVRAPISGYITEVNTTMGSFLDAAATALEITNTDHLHLELEVFEKDIQQIREGQLIKFRVPGASPDPYLARVHLIGNTVEGESRVVRVHGHFEEEEKGRGLIPGMYIEAVIETQADSVMALPEEAVVRVEDNAYILVQNDRTSDSYIFDRQLVQTGRVANGMIELKEDPMRIVKGPVLVKGAFNLITE